MNGLISTWDEIWKFACPTRGRGMSPQKALAISKGQRGMLCARKNKKTGKTIYNIDREKGGDAVKAWTKQQREKAKGKKQASERSEWIKKMKAKERDRAARGESVQGATAEPPEPKSEPIVEEKSPDTREKAEKKEEKKKAGKKAHNYKWPKGMYPSEKARIRQEMKEMGVSTYPEYMAAKTRQEQERLKKIKSSPDDSYYRGEDEKSASSPITATDPETGEKYETHTGGSKPAPQARDMLGIIRANYRSGMGEHRGTYWIKDLWKNLKKRDIGMSKEQFDHQLKGLRDSGAIELSETIEIEDLKEHEIIRDPAKIYFALQIPDIFNQFQSSWDSIWRLIGGRRP